MKKIVYTVAISFLFQMPLFAENKKQIHSQKELQIKVQKHIDKSIGGLPHEMWTLS
jgi:hypothetical protein